MIEKQFDIAEATDAVVRKMKDRMNSSEFFEPNMEALRAYAEKLRAPKETIQMVKLSPDQVANAMVGRAKMLMFLKSKEEEEYNVDSHNVKQLTAIKWYVMQDKRFESEGFGSLHKGLCLQGLQGCGKTMILKVISDIGHVWERHTDQITTKQELLKKGWGDGIRFGMYFMNDIVSCIRLEHDYRANGEKAIQTIRAINRPMVFDDLGFERSETLNYGNRVNIMEQMIQHRYDMFVDCGVKTHFSTNLVNGNQIEEIYGPRSRSRLREMCNFIVFDTDSHIDRRK